MRRKIINNIKVIGFIFIATIIVSLAPLNAFANENVGHVHRFAGSNRVTTSIEVSKNFYDKSDTVIIAGWDGMVDALSGTLLSAEKDAPVIISNSKSLNKETKEELARLGVKNAYILGGNEVVSSEVDSDLIEMGITPNRLDGTNRQDTAVKVAEEAIGGKIDSVFLTKGWASNDSDSLADALAIGPISGSERKPILLSRSNEIPKETIEMINSHEVSNVTIIGGYNAISKKIEDRLVQKGLNVDRIAGSNREDTAIKIFEKYYDKDTNIAMFVNGYNAVDALIGGYTANKSNAPILFTNTNTLSNITSQFVSNTNIEHGYVIGGKQVLSEDVRESLINSILRIDRANTDTPINIQTPEPHASISGQTTHPDVTYIKDGWNGHKYWMAHTPYHNTNEKVENPSVSYSDDGVNFKTFEGTSNPIDSPADGLVEDRAHMSDTDLIIKPDGTMEVYYRYRDRAKGKGETIYRKTSKDAVNWTEREVVMRGHDDVGNNILSPALIYDDNMYRMWWVEKGAIYTSTSESSLEGTWSKKAKVGLEFMGEVLTPWHLDVAKEDGLYHLILNADPTNQSRRTLALGVSTDGLSFDNIYTIMRPTESSWDNYDIYRASMVKVDDVYKLYYSATNRNREWYVGLSESTDLKYWNGVTVQH